MTSASQSDTMEKLIQELDGSLKSTLTNILQYSDKGTSEDAQLQGKSKIPSKSHILQIKAFNSKVTVPKHQNHSLNKDYSAQVSKISFDLKTIQKTLLDNVTQLSSKSNMKTCAEIEDLEKTIELKKQALSKHSNNLQKWAKTLKALELENQKIILHKNSM
ncbi:hypothetical protein BB561_000084 [Smittium simulii]|uniref:Uncharacterized protein n=1 Tax=Smittium simulii TaxID=133385 RepID=A0A2T9Z0P5_9FUNG|nr:hypothetical protein BB561_000084 [Smittium simulii]